MSNIVPLRPLPPVRLVRGATPAPVASAAPPAAARPAVQARGPVDTGAKAVGAVLGTAAGLAGAGSLALLFALSQTPIGLVGGLVMAGIVGIGGVIGYLGGDRIGDWLEGTPLKGERHTAAQIMGGLAGGVLGLTGGVWLSVFVVGQLTGIAALSAATTLLVTALGAIGGAEGARRLVELVKR